MSPLTLTPTHILRLVVYNSVCLFLFAFSSRDFVFSLSSVVKGLSSETDQDRQIVEQQLGYFPTNFARVSARSRRGDPVAIQTYPLQGGSPRRQARSALYGLQNNKTAASIGTPFPTLYWLTCPQVSRAISILEQNGFLSHVKREIEQNKQLQIDLLKSHNEYAKERWDSLSVEHTAVLLSEDPSIMRMRQILQYSGISGSNLTKPHNDDEENFFPSIKCLHTHYAHCRSCTNLVDSSLVLSKGQTLNPVGMMVHRQLLQEFPDLIL